VDPSLIEAAESAISQQRPQDAIAILQPAMTDDTDPRLHHVMGVAKGLAGDLPGAIAHFETAIAINPSFNQAIYALGIIHSNQGRFHDAIGYFARSAELDPRFEHNRYLLAAAHLQAGNSADAITWLTELCAAEPQNQRFIEVLNFTVQKIGGMAPAVEALLAHDRAEPAALLLLAHGAGVPDEKTTLWTLAVQLMSKDRFRLGQRLFERLVTIDPKNWAAGWNAHICRLRLSLLDGTLDWLKRLDQPDNPHRARIRDEILYIAPLEPDVTMVDLRHLTVSLQHDIVGAVVPMTHPMPSLERRPLRVGFLSRLFPMPNFARIYTGLFAALDRTQFRVIALYSGNGSASLDPLGSSVDEIVMLSGLDHQAAATRIREAEIDLLMDCNGFGSSEGNRILDFKPAPVQIVWSNKHCTSGMPSMDWVLADPSIAGIDPACFVERVHAMPLFHIGSALQEAPDVTESPASRNGYVTLGAQIAGLKLNKPMMRSWAAMLHRLPTARFLLRFGVVPETHDMVREFMKAEGIAPDRLDLKLGPQSQWDYLETYGEMDMALDRFPISGGVTTFETLWQGVPLLSWMGETWAGRRGGVLLRQLGLPELVFDSPESYIEGAVSLAQDLDRLVHYRTGLRDHLLRFGIGDDRPLARAMGDALLHFWQEYVAARRTG
jgi:predicted O-linked N-acetylglucosamine transferase (SPINDLY family)